MSLVKIEELTKLQPGDSFKSIFVITGIYQKTDKNGKPYYDISVSDSTGNIEAKVWSDASFYDRTEDVEDPKEITSDEEKLDLMGKTVGVNGKITEYRKQLQFNFNKITLLNQDKFPAAQYLPRSPIPVEDMIERYNSLINSCNPHIANFLKFVYKDEMWKKFRDWPAAVSHHHAYANGLLEHTLAVADCAKSMAESMNRSGYNINVDLVVAGGLLHDLGKIDSYKMTSIPEMTLEGAVIDHVVQGYFHFIRYAEEYGLDESIKLQLAHILLSHHGQKDYGSPVVPATPEALIVSAADELDFRIFCWHDSVKDLPDNQPISQWHAATARRFWKRDEPKEQ